MRIVEVMQGDELAWAYLEQADRKGLRLRTPGGRQFRVPADRILFEHDGTDPDAVAAQRDALAAEVDVPLLWEAAREEFGDKELAPSVLAGLYFSEDGPLHSSAIYQAVARDRLHFRRRGRHFAPREPESIEALRIQIQREAQREAERASLREALATRALDDRLAARLEAWLRGRDDGVLQDVLDSLYRDPERDVFELLLATGRLSPLTDLEVLRADLQTAHPAPVVAHAEALPDPPLRGTPVSGAFSIDDPDTEEVDDVLSACRDGSLIRIDIDIADAAAWIRPGDPVDREARRRASSAYLPTGRVPMLPERLGCQRASLHPGAPRPALRASVWCDGSGTPVRTEFTRVSLEVQRRLDYEEADRLLEDHESPDGDTLRLLWNAAQALRERRQEAGAFSFQRPEWKVRVSDQGERIEIKRVPADSPSRALVAEMMILVNQLAGAEAAKHGIPVLFRTQPAPAGPLPDPEDPSAFEKMRGALQPASFSLHPEPHAGLGVAHYVQCSSPLRRYADLVAQRQIAAHLAGEPPPHSADELLRVLANAEAVERELRRVEAATTQRWALEWLSRQPPDTPEPAEVVTSHPKGHLVVLLRCGARGVLEDDAPRAPGDQLTVRVRRVVPRAGVLRLRPVP